MSRPTQDTARLQLISCTGLSPSMVQLSRSFHYQFLLMSQSYNPTDAETSVVWAVPRSLAATEGITIVFSSSGYLDVSVHRVSLLTDNTASLYWVAPFGNLRVESYLHLTVAYRSLSRPSSPPRAKASTIRP